MSVYAYVRVSTDKQDYENQKIGIISVAESRNLLIDKWIVDDGVSGTVEPEKRRLGKLLKHLQPGDTLIAGEISRFGRSLFMIMRILEYCMNKEIKIFTVKDGYELGDNILSKCLAFAFGLCAEIERDLISKRTKEGLQRRKEMGISLGRPKGYRPVNTKLHNKEEYIVKMLTKGWTKKKISKKLKVSRWTLRLKLKEMGLQ